MTIKRKTKKITLEELAAIKQIYYNLCFAYGDHQYLSKSGGLDIARLAFLSKNQILFKRIQYYLFHFTIIEINKVLSDTESYAIRKYLEYEISLDNQQYKDDLLLILNKLDNDETSSLKVKVTKLRNKAVAHLTPQRRSLKGATILVSEVELILNLLHNFIQVFNIIVEGSEYVFPIKAENYGYELHKQHAKSLWVGRGKQIT